MDTVNIIKPFRQRAVSLADGASALKGYADDRTQSAMAQGIEALNSVLCPMGNVWDVLSPDQKKGLTLLRLSICNMDNRSAYVPSDLLSDSPNGEKNPNHEFLRGHFGGVGDVAKKKSGKEQWQKLKTSMKVMHAFSARHLQTPQREKKIPSEWETLSSDVQNRLRNILSWENLRRWDFDVMELSELTKGKPILFLGWAVIGSPHAQWEMKGDVDGSAPDGYDFIKEGLSMTKLMRFLRTIESKYNATNQYHNNIHAADVLQTVHALLQMGCDKLTGPSFEMTYAMLIAAVIHDINHPGRNNAFQIRTNSSIALDYNDISVLENMHVSEAFKLLKGSGRDPELDILEFLPDEILREVRSLIIKLVLRTDMSFHFKDMAALKGLLSDTSLDDVETGEFLEDDDIRHQALCFLLHVADVSNQAKPKLFREWSYRCLDEFFSQGDEERALGIPISPLCDRHNTDLCSSQASFIKYVIAPTFAILGVILPRVATEIIPIVDANLAHWENGVDTWEQLGELRLNN